MVTIYILKLEGGRYYVGKTNNLEERLEAHKSGRGNTAWTNKYKFIDVVDIITDCDDYDEDKYVRIYMDKYGIDKVRGGSFSSIKLDDADISVLIKMSDNANNKCFACGGDDHFAKDCPHLIEEEEISLSSPLTNLCRRCGRNNHTVDNCYAKKDIDGLDIED